MPRLLISIILSILLQGCFSVRSNSSFSYKKLTPENYAEKLAQHPDFYLIDVRTPGEFNKSHIRGAINLSFLAFNFGRQVDSLERKKTVFLYCHTCHRSPFCARILRRKGFTNVYDMENGFTRWLKSGLPADAGSLSTDFQQ